MVNYSDWMGQLYQHFQRGDSNRFGDVPLCQLPIPGSHDSGTYGTFTVQDSAARTQNKTLAQQLALGIRYFDLRPLVDSDSFYIAHWAKSDVLIAKWTGDEGLTEAAMDADRTSLLGKLRHFLKNHSKEVVIIKLQSFDAATSQSFNADDHIHFRKLLAAYLPLIAPTPVADLTLSRIYHETGRVLVFHDFKDDGAPNDASWAKIWPYQVSPALRSVVHGFEGVGRAGGQEVHDVVRDREDREHRSRVAAGGADVEHVEEEALLRDRRLGARDVVQLLAVAVDVAVDDGARRSELLRSALEQRSGAAGLGRAIADAARQGVGVARQRRAVGQPERHADVGVLVHGHVHAAERRRGADVGQATVLGVATVRLDDRLDRISVAVAQQPARVQAGWRGRTVHVQGGARAGRAGGAAGVVALLVAREGGDEGEAGDPAEAAKARVSVRYEVHHSKVPASSRAHKRGDRRGVTSPVSGGPGPPQVRPRSVDSRTIHGPSSAAVHCVNLAAHVGDPDP